MHYGGRSEILVLRCAEGGERQTVEQHANNTPAAARTFISPHQHRIKMKRHGGVDRRGKSWRNVKIFPVFQLSFINSGWLFTIHSHRPDTGKHRAAQHAVDPRGGDGGGGGGEEEEEEGKKKSY